MTWPGKRWGFNFSILSSYGLANAITIEPQTKYQNYHKIQVYLTLNEVI